MEEVKYYSTQELIDMFRVSRYAIYRANLSGALPIAKKEGNQNYYSEDSVRNYIEQSGKSKSNNK